MVMGVRVWFMMSRMWVVMFRRVLGEVVFMLVMFVSMATMV